MAGHEQVEQYEKQVHELQTQVKFLEDEVALLRRRLSNSPRQVEVLEEKLVETRGQLARATAQNEKLADALRAERDRIETLNEEVEKLTQPPATFGVFLRAERRRVDGHVHRRPQDARAAGARHRARQDPAGLEVILNEALNVVEVLAPDGAGEVVKVKERLGDDRAIVLGRGDEEHVAYLAGELLSTRRAGRRRRAVRPPLGGGHREAARARRSRSSSSRRSPTSPTRTSAGSRARST